MVLFGVYHAEGGEEKVEAAETGPLEDGEGENYGREGEEFGGVDEGTL